MLIDWGQVPDPQAKNSGGSKGDSKFVAMEENSSNFFRIVSDEIFVILQHFERAGKSGRYFKCANPVRIDDRGRPRVDDKGLCPICKETNEETQRNKYPRPYYLFLALEKKTDQVKILRVPEQVAVALKKNARSKNWGDLRQYDVDIQKGPKGSNPLYMVQPQPKEELTLEQKAIVEANTIDLKKYANPGNAEWITKELTAMRNGGGGPSNSQAKPPQKQAAAEPAAPPPEVPVDNSFETAPAAPTGADPNFEADFDNLA